MREFLLIIGAFLLLLFSTVAKAGIEGYWMSDNGLFIVHIIKTHSNEYKGYVEWLKNPTYPENDKMAGVELFDRNNKDPVLRHRKALGLLSLGGLHQSTPNHFTGGWVYDFWHGKMYHGSAKLVNNDTLDLRGSVDAWGILGHSIEVTRIKDTSKYFKIPPKHHE